MAHAPESTYTKQESTTKDVINDEVNCPQSFGEVEFHNAEFVSAEHLNYTSENTNCDEIVTEDVYYYAENGDILTQDMGIVGYIEKNALSALKLGKDFCFKCPVCNDLYCTYEDLKVHSYAYHAATVYKSIECDSEEPKQHTKVYSHYPNNKFQCVTCDKIFVRKASLIRHQGVHSDAHPFKCDLCGKKFNQKANLGKHYKIHRGEYSFQCGICNKKFIQKANLQKHMLIHSGTVSFECDICGKKFIQKANLDIHYKIHLGEYSFQCEVCDKKFIQKVNCLKHMKVHMKKEEQEECTQQ